MTTYNIQHITNNKIFLFISLACISILVSHFLFFSIANGQSPFDVNVSKDTTRGIITSPPTREIQIDRDAARRPERQIDRDTGGSQVITIPNPLGVNTIAELIGRIINWLLIIASTAIVPLMIIVGAFQIMSASGNPEKLTRGKQTVTYTIIGYALLLLTTGIIKIIESVLQVKN